MAKKRKSQATNLDEVDRTMYSTFCSGANSLSQLYTQAMNQQKLSFQAGERHGLEKLYQWILRQQEGGSRVTTVDILTYLQTDPDCCGEEPSMSPRAPLQNQHSQATCVFSDALSSPVRRSLQNYHIAQEDYYSNDVLVQSSANGVRNNEPNFVEHQNRDSDPFNNDSSMDMHADSPGHESTY